MGFEKKKKNITIIFKKCIEKGRPKRCDQVHNISKYGRELKRVIQL
jgi:hypothetical protein